MEGSKFYFINKGATSDCLTKSRGTQWSEIQRHVQKGLSRPRKSKSPRNTDATPVDDQALYNPTVRSIACKYDPFKTASIHIDGTVRTLLQYYIYFYHPTLWTYEPAAINSDPYAFKSSVVNVVSTALEDPLAMYTLLSAAASRLRHVDGLLSTIPPEKDHFFTQQALCLMQERINAAELQSSTLIERLASYISFLGSAESYRDDYPASKTHLQAALKLLEPSGGVMQVKDKNLQGQLLMGDLFLSCVNMEPCQCGSEYDPGPASTLAWSEDELQLSDDPVLGTILLEKNHTILPLVLWESVLQILESYRTKQRLNTHNMSPERSFEINYWVIKRNMAVRNKLLAFVTSDERVHALRTALIMWTLLSMNITGRVKTVKIMASKLKLVMESISPGGWEGEEDIELWTLLMGCSCAEDGSTIYSWFVEQIRRLRTENTHITLTHPQKDDLSRALETFQQGFLFHGPVQRTRTEKLAELLTWWA